MTPVDLIEVGGSLLILSAFAAAQTHRLSPHSVRYLLLNIVGSAVLAVIALLHQSWGFLLLEGSWAIISTVSLLRMTRHDDRTAARTSGAQRADSPGR
ncbi:hypothetical protein I0C86_29160 [Plantactinospora sp. S1510]|uniref:CBU-0592-like domain-containing protein n=1 Tax=Plantactinospora alkalitolerans TaxID=2789879 RepID=A0ABS0H4D5_9ACTN|nr:hypothetical protein [Plantactinospora alkalitolerans]MBF9132999.1 hypothetical protein [Plantactinospora alkalitolerans]